MEIYVNRSTWGLATFFAVGPNMARRGERIAECFGLKLVEYGRLN